MTPLIATLARASFVVVIVVLMLLRPATISAAELVMLEEHGCSWCELWEKEVGVIYHKTPEGQRAPLRRLDIHEPLPSDLKFLVKGGYTPTFVLIEDGREVGRIRGYPGEDFFWGLLGKMLERLPTKTSTSEVN